MNLTTHEIPATVAAPGAVDRRIVAAPATPPAATLKPDAQPAASIDAAVQALNERYARLQSDLRFRVDDSTGQTVVSVVDAQDGTVLRQIPSEEVLRVMQQFDHLNHRGALIRRTA